MSLDEISAVVAAPAETVKSRLRYAMRKLRGCQTWPYKRGWVSWRTVARTARS